MQLSLKEILAKILAWIKNPVLHNSVLNTDTMLNAYRDDTEVGVGFGIGTGGVNHGVFSRPLNKWMIYADASTVRVNDVNMRVYGTTSYSGILTPTSGVTIHSFAYAEWGKIATLYLSWSRNSTISVGADGNITNATIGNLAAAYRPWTASTGTSYGDNGGPAFYLLSTDGNIQMGAVGGTGAARTIAAGTQFQLGIVYYKNAN